MPTGFTTVSGSNLQDSTGTLVQNATIYFQPVDNNGNVISFRAGGGGQVLSRPVQTQVVDGVFSVVLADTTLTSPVNVGYAVTVIDYLTGNSVLGPGYGCIQPSGSTWDFDSFVPNLAAMITVQAGPPGPAGGIFTVDETYTAAGTKTVVHGLGTANPIIQAKIYSGATEFYATYVDENTVNLTSPGPMVVTFIFLGGSLVPVEPSIVLNPTAQSGISGDVITFTAGAGGAPTPSVQWYTDTGTSGVTWTSIGGATSTTYSFTAAGQNGYQYRATFTNASGSATTSPAAVSIVDLTAGLTNYWPYNEGTGTTIHDTVGSLTMTGVTAGTWTSGKFVIAGGNAGIPSGVPAPLFPDSAFSVSMHAKITAYTAFGTYIATTNYSGHPGIGIWVDASGVLNYVLVDGTGATTTANSVTGAIALGTEYHLVFTNDGTGTNAGLGVVINGVAATQTHTITGTCVYGGGTDNPAFMQDQNGYVYGLRIYDHIIGAPVIAALGSAGI